MQNKIVTQSLRNRAIIFSIAISFLLVAISFFGYSNFKSFHQESSFQIQQRDDFLISLSSMRGKLLDAYKDLNQFLLAPENAESQKHVIESIQETIEISLLLNEHPWIEKYKREKVLSFLTAELNLLKADIKNLIRVRLDSNNQYPSLAVSAEIMQPNRDRLNNLLALALNEANQENMQVSKPLAYQNLLQVRHLWEQVLSNFRLYLANRVGSFNKKALPIQEKAIEVQFEELKSQLITLKAFAAAGKFGFETSNVIPEMESSALNWYQGFNKVKIIHHSDEWRRDAKIMKTIVSPRIDSVTKTLILLEQIIGDAAADDMKSYSSLGDEQNKIVWLIAFLGILFTMIIIIALDKLIFKPISLVSNALKQEALGHQSDNLFVFKTKETQELVDAFSEMSYQVHQRQKELEYRALHDALTALPNRTLLIDRITHNIHVAKREKQQFSLLILDLDDFKEVNDTLGHFAGDDLLIEVGNRIKNILRDVDTIARIGGDEFSVLLPHTNEEQAIITAQKILSVFQKTVHVDDIEVSVSSSVGIAVFPYHGEDVDTLLRHADVAMYVAKRNKLGFEVYSEDDDDNSLSRLSMTRDFRNAMKNDDLTVEFQPIYDMEHKNIIAVEALSRWYHPEHGNVSPEKFIVLAEQTSLINALTYWVLEKSIAQVSLWHEQGHDLLVAVNLSVFSFKDPDFVGEVRSLLRKYDFPSDKLKLEITESAMMDNPLIAIETLTALQSMGVKLSIDDFGTGFSSMTYLKQFPVDELKIDKSFIYGLDTDESNDAIVRSTIDLAHNLGLKVVAEGIESKAVHELLEKYDCDMAQGFHLSHPISAHDLQKLLKK